MSNPSIIYDCPGCGQGGLELVRLKNASRTEAYVCSECDRIWLKPDKVCFGNTQRVGSTLREFGLTREWDDIERISAGVSWDDIAPAYQQILLRESVDR